MPRCVDCTQCADFLDIRAADKCVMETPLAAAPPPDAEGAVAASPLRPMAMQLLDDVAEDACQPEPSMMPEKAPLAGGSHGSESDSDSDVVPETNQKAAAPNIQSRPLSPPPSICECTYA